MVETSDENVDNCRKALEEAIKRAKTAHDQLNDKKKWRKIVQKRRLLVGKAAMKEDNSDLGKFSYHKRVLIKT
jgi:polyhydroxyalkanoate synthesis regulator phasin